jgi:hypothetical protein
MSALVFSMVGAAAQAQPSYQVTAIRPPFTGTQCGARGVNNFGHVTGWAQVGSTTRIFLYTPTAGSSDVGDIGVSNTSYGGYAINDSDVIVGQNYVGGYVHSFRLDCVHNEFNDITLNETNGSFPQAYAYAINAGGDIAGSLTFNCAGAATNLQAAHWTWTPGGPSAVSLGTYDLCSTSYALCLNNVGDLAGYGLRTIGSYGWYRPTLWHAGTMIDLGVFGASGDGHGYVNAINDFGVCAGWAENRENPNSDWYAPCLWTAAGGIVNLNDAADPTYPGFAKSINNAGFVVGTSGALPTIWTPSGAKFSLASRIINPQPGMTLSDAVGISNTGFVVCNGAQIGSGFGPQAFLLTPCTPGIAVQPADLSVPTMTPVTISVVAVGAGELTYQWRRNGSALSDGTAAGGGVLSGATTHTLSISTATCYDHGNYDCIVTGSFGGPTTSGAATLTITGCICISDFNNDGDSGTDADLEAFFRCIAGNCCMACAMPDFNGDGDTGTDADIESFFRVLAGGPC